MAYSEKFWDRFAKKYSKATIADSASYEKKLAETRQHLTSDMQVVEFGCGTGSTAIAHAAHVKHIAAIDVSQNMLDIGQEKAAQAGINNINFIRGTLIQYNADTASVDLVLGLNVVHLLPDRQATLKEVHRILKPGGLFISSTACIGDSYLRLIKLLTPIGKLTGLMPDVFVLTEADLAREIKDAGFSIENQWHHGKQAKTVFVVAKR